MSKDNAKKFLEDLQKDEALRKQVREASEKIIDIAKQHKLEFTREELRAVMRERCKDDDGFKVFDHFSEAPGF